MPNDEQRNLNVNINAEIYDSFSNQAEQLGRKKFRVMEAALQAWLALDPEQQRLWMEGKNPDSIESEDDLKKRIVGILQELELLPQTYARVSRAKKGKGKSSRTPE